MACRLIVGSQRFSGVVLDISSTGLFVQTTAKPNPREPVTVELAVPGHREPLRLESEVARLYMVPPQLLTVAQGGVGLRIRNAPEAFFGLLEQLQRDDAAAAPSASGEEAPAPADARRRYRVRMTQLGRARTRTLRLLADSAEEAAALACAESGEGWKVLESIEDEAPAPRS